MENKDLEKLEDNVTTITKDVEKNIQLSEELMNDDTIIDKESKSIQDVNLKNKKSSKISNKSNKSKIEESKKEVKKHQFQKKVEDNLDDITKAINSIADDVDEATEYKQTFEEDKPTFIEKSIPDISEKVKEKSSLKNTLITSAVVASILKMLSLYEEASQHENGILGWLWDKSKNIGSMIWNTLNSYADENGGWVELFKNAGFKALEILQNIGNKTLKILTNFGEWLGENSYYLFETINNYIEKQGGWGKYIVSKLKDSIDFVTEISDAVLYKLLGNNYLELKEFLNSKLIYIKEWWEEVENYGFTGWVYKQFYDYFKGKIDFKLFEWELPEPVKILKEDISIKTIEKEKEEKIERRRKLYKEHKERIANIENTYYKEKKINKNLKKSEFYKSYIDNSLKIFKKEDAKSIKNITKVKKQKWMKVITSKFKAKESIRNNRIHNGVDFRTKIGTKITSISEGYVEKIQRDLRGGLVLSIQNNDGKRVLYMHLSKVLVKKGDKVYPGSEIALSGNSGKPQTGGKYVPHIHLAVKDTKNGYPGKPINPIKYIESVKNKNILNEIDDKVVIVNKKLNIKTHKKETKISGLNNSEKRLIDKNFDVLSKKVAMLNANKNSSIYLQTEHFKG